MSKHLLNNKSDWAKESIKGFLHLNASNVIALQQYPNVVLRRDYLSLQEESNSRVALISGGGSGHEPSHLGFIGHGMLTGVVCGDLFASPSIQSILAAIRFVGKSNKAGVLLIVKNYTGDRLNFGLASKRAQLEGINVDWILVNDDVALVDSEDQRDSTVGKRGLCGTVLVHKIAGALAEQRKSLKEIKQTLDYILKGNNLKTLGVSLSGRVKLPSDDNHIESVSQKEQKPSDLIDIGLGIHNERGRTSIKLEKSYELVKFVFNDYLLKNEMDREHNLCLVINNLGGLSNLELYLLINDCQRYFQEKVNYKLRRVYCGTLMTSLGMNGFSLTVLNLDSSNLDLVLKSLDLSTSAPGWPKSYGVDLKPFEYVACEENLSVTSDLDSSLYINFTSYSSNLSLLLKSILQSACESLIDSTGYLNNLDEECGDGDCGSTLAKISKNIQDDIENNKFDFDYPHQVILQLSRIFENGGGSLSILLALFMSAGAKAFAHTTSLEKNDLFWARIWLTFLENGINAVEEYGCAKPNQRSIIDPLTAVREFAKDSLSSMSVHELLKSMVDVAYKSAESTASMKPRVGRASYVDSSSIKNPDAGAYAISLIVSSVYKAYLLNRSN